MLHVARNIQRARRAKGHTQESLARALDLGVRTVQTWEQGATLPRRANLEALAGELDCEPAWFYERHEDPEPEKAAA